MEISKGYVTLTLYLIPHVTTDRTTQPNILVDDDNNALLCDFGLASITADAHSAHASTVNSAGSIRWMAPERLAIFDASSEPTPTGVRVTKESDMYSLSMVVIEVRTTLPHTVCLLSLTPDGSPCHTDVHGKPSVLGHPGRRSDPQARSTQASEETRGGHSARVDRPDLGNR